MVRIGTGLGVLGAALLVFLGCKNDGPLKPPKEDPVYVLPPDDPRYSSYPKFPDNTMNKWPKREMPDPNDPAAKGPPKFGALGAPGGGGP